MLSLDLCTALHFLFYFLFVFCLWLHFRQHNSNCRPLFNKPGLRRLASPNKAETFTDITETRQETLVRMLYNIMPICASNTSVADCPWHKHPYKNKVEGTSVSSSSEGVEIPLRRQHERTKHGKHAWLPRKRRVLLAIICKLAKDFSLGLVLLSAADETNTALTVLKILQGSLQTTNTGS